jgi:signal peptidase II
MKPLVSDMNGMMLRAWDFWVRRSWMLWILAAVVLLLDQSTKSVIAAWLNWGQSWPDEGFLRLTHARNTGTAFSLFQGHSNILSVVAIFAVVLLLWVYAATGAKSLRLRSALGLQLGGALGNLLDRLQQGYVTDFIDVGPWPIFNIADSSISVGMVLMVWYFLTNREEEKATPVVAPAERIAESASADCQRSSNAMGYETLKDADSDVSEADIRS